MTTAAAAAACHAAGAALSRCLAPERQREAWYKLYVHAASAALSLTLLLLERRLSWNGFLLSEACLPERGPPPGAQTLFLFELFYCVLDGVVLLRSPSDAKGRADLLLHHAATAALIASGQALRHWDLGLHFLATAGPATLLLCARDVGLSFRSGLVGGAFATTFLWARLALVPAAFASKLTLCQSWPVFAAAPQTVLVLLGVKWSAQLGHSLVKKARRGSASASTAAPPSEAS